MDDDERKQKIFQFLGRVASMYIDEECLEHGKGCEPFSNDKCEYFYMTDDDAVETLNNLIRTARELHLNANQD